MALEIGYCLVWFIGILLSLSLLCNFIRNYSSVTVNCWFCNTNFKVPFKLRNEWFCEQCQQFNGFNDDGDYSKILPEQFDETLNQKYVTPTFGNKNKPVFSSNGLCSICNSNQELKIKQLALYVPFQEENYDEEIELFKNKLENSYKLCENCEKVVREKLLLKSDDTNFSTNSKLQKINVRPQRSLLPEFTEKFAVYSILLSIVGILIACAFSVESIRKSVVDLINSYHITDFFFNEAFQPYYGLALDWTFALSAAICSRIFFSGFQYFINILIVMFSLMISSDLAPIVKLFVIITAVFSKIVKCAFEKRTKTQFRLQKLNNVLSNELILERDSSSSKDTFEKSTFPRKSDSSPRWYNNTPLCGKFSDMCLGKCEKYVSQLPRQSPSPYSLRSKNLIQPSKLKMDEFDDNADTPRTSPTVSSGYESIGGGFGYSRRNVDNVSEFDSVSQINFASSRNHLFSCVAKTPERTPDFRSVDSLSLSSTTKRYYGAMPIYSSANMSLSHSSSSYDLSNDKSHIQVNACVPMFQIVLCSVMCFVLGFSFQILARAVFVDST